MSQLAGWTPAAGAAWSAAKRAAFLRGLNTSYADLTTPDFLGVVLGWLPGRLTFANSFGAEDLVLQHLLLAHPVPTDTVVLDTGRLPAETYALIERWRSQFGIRPRLVHPDAAALEDFTTTHGPDAFRHSKNLRLDCCQVRKLAPLERALAGKEAWLTGLRRGQSSARQATDLFAFDQAGRLKISPLAAWDSAAVWSYIRAHALPYNALHDQGYPSIGCAPCSRAIAPGADERSGRWWWEADEHRECGLHQHRPAPSAYEASHD